MVTRAAPVPFRPSDRQERPWRALRARLSRASPGVRYSLSGWPSVTKGELASSSECACGPAGSSFGGGSHSRNHIGCGPARLKLLLVREPHLLLTEHVWLPEACQAPPPLFCLVPRPTEIRPLTPVSDHLTPQLLLEWEQLVPSEGAQTRQSAPMIDSVRTDGHATAMQHRRQPSWPPAVRGGPRSHSVGGSCCSVASRFDCRSVAWS